MQPSEFDQLIRQKFDNAEMPFNADHWERLQYRLPVRKQKKPFVLWLSAAGMAASVALAVVYFGIDIKNDGQRIAVTPAPSFTPLANKIEKRGADNFAASGSGNTGQLTARTPKHATTIAAAPKTKTAPPATPDIPFCPPGENDSLLWADASEVKDSVLKVTLKPRKTALPDILPENETARSTKTSFSVTGGYNYGTMNGGYNVAMVAQHNLSKKIFIEGQVGIVNSNTQHIQAMAGSAFSGQEDFFQGGGVSNLSSGATLVQLPVSLFYVQVAPMFGYNISRNISVAAGADMQKILEADKDVAIRTDIDGGVQILPQFDMGVTGKTEYSITERLKAGVLYRSAINRVIKNDLYLNRNYMQVQIKYKINR